MMFAIQRDKLAATACWGSPSVVSLWTDVFGDLDSISFRQFVEKYASCKCSIGQVEIPGIGRIAEIDVAWVWCFSLYETLITTQLIPWPEILDSYEDQNNAQHVFLNSTTDELLRVADVLDSLFAKTQAV